MAHEQPLRYRPLTPLNRGNPTDRSNAAFLPRMREGAQAAAGKRAAAYTQHLKAEDRLSEGLKGLRAVTRPEIEHDVDKVEMIPALQESMSRSKWRWMRRLAVDGPERGRSFKLTEYGHGTPSSNIKDHNYRRHAETKGWVLPNIINLPTGEQPYAKIVGVPQQWRHDTLTIEKDGLGSWAGGVLRHRAPHPDGSLPQRAIGVGRVVGGFLQYNDSAREDWTRAAPTEHFTHINQKTDRLDKVTKAVIDLGAEALRMSIMEHNPHLTPINGPSPGFAEDWRKIVPLAISSR